MLSNKKTDKTGYNQAYKGRISPFASDCSTPEEYITNYEKKALTPFCKGGPTKGYVRGLAVTKLLETTSSANAAEKDITILDAGCGLGSLSTYLACKGYNVIGVDISSEACQAATKLTQDLGVSDKCTFLAESLDNLSVIDSSIDYIIGHASLHHFIKYENVPNEFHRILKAGGKGFFADSFGENRIYHIFHDKEQMERLGDVILTKKLIDSYFKDFYIEITPTDWFVMFDKLYLKFLPNKFDSAIRAISKLHFFLDRAIPKNRASLYLSGAVLTSISK